MEIIRLNSAEAGSAGKPKFEKLYESCYEKILFYILKKTGSREDAEDLTGEVFLYAYDHYGSFDPAKSSVNAWLYLIVNCRLKNYYRDKKVWVDIGELENTLFTDGDEMGKAVWLEQLRAQLERALDRLPEKQREAVVLRYFKDMSYEDIAGKLHTTPGNARVILSRALSRLKETCEIID